MHLLLLLSVNIPVLWCYAVLPLLLKLLFYYDLIEIKRLKKQPVKVTFKTKFSFDHWSLDSTICFVCVCVCVPKLHNGMESAFVM